MQSPPDMEGQQGAAERFARRHFEALQQAGLTSWSFEEFYAFCSPLALEAAGVQRGIDDAASRKAGKLADAISEVLRRRYGKPLRRETRERIRHIAAAAIVERNRQRIHLARPR